MLTIRAYSPAALPVFPPPPPSPPPPPPPSPGSVLDTYVNAEALPQVDPEGLPDYHPSWYGFLFPLPPRVTRPDAKRNQISWPLWGLSCYAEGHVLVTSEEYRALLDYPGYSGAVQVSYDDGAGGTGTLYMRVLAATPVSDPRTPPLVGTPAASPAATTEPVAWVLTLSDERYLWNERVYVGSGSSAPATWGDLISDLVSQACGQTVSASTINTLLTGAPAYPTPGTVWAKDRLNGLSACCLLDAACAAVNLRAAVAADGTVTLQSATTAGTALSATAGTHSPDLASGGVTYGGLDLPEAVRFLSYDETGLTAINRVAVTGGTHGEVVAAVPFDDANGRTRYAADFVAWYDQSVFDATFAGFKAIPVCASLGTWVLDHDAGVTRIVSPPGRYPWPLASGSLASSGGMTSSDSDSGFWGLLIGRSGTAGGYTYTYRKLEKGATPTEFRTTSVTGTAIEVRNRLVKVVADPGLGWNSAGPPDTAEAVVRIHEENDGAGVYYSFAADQEARSEYWGVVTDETEQIWRGVKSLENGTGGWVSYSWAGSVSPIPLGTNYWIAQVGRGGAEISVSVGVPSGNPGSGSSVISAVGSWIYCSQNVGVSTPGAGVQVFYNVGAQQIFGPGSNVVLVYSVLSGVAPGFNGTGETIGYSRQVTLGASVGNINRVHIGQAFMETVDAISGSRIDVTVYGAVNGGFGWTADFGLGGTADAFFVWRGGSKKRGIDASIIVGTQQNLFYGGLLTSQVSLVSPPPPPAPSPGIGWLRVRVMDQTGAALDNRGITLGGSVSGSGTTNVSGEVTFTSLTAGTGATATLRVATGESVSASASWTGGSALGNTDTISFDVVEDEWTEVVFVVGGGGLAQSAALAGGGQVDNYALPYSGQTMLLGVSGGATDLTGIVAGANGERRLLINTGPDTLTIKHQHTGSSAANRFIVSTGADQAIAADEGKWMVYDGNATRWRLIV